MLKTIMLFESSTQAMLFTPSLVRKCRDEQLFMLSHGKLSQVKWVTSHETRDQPHFSCRW